MNDGAIERGAAALDVLAGDGEQADAHGVVDRAIIATVAGDPGALFEDAAVAALRQLSPAAWARTRARIKKECRDVRITDVDASRRDPGAGGDEAPASVAIELARKAGEFFKDADGVAYATVAGTHARETWRVDSRGFRDWLCAAYYRATDTGLSDLSLTTALNTLRAAAIHDGAVRIVGQRVVAHDGGVFIELGDETWQAVHITAAGWRIANAGELPVRLYRTAGMIALPNPVHRGEIDLLWPHVNIPAGFRPLVLAWLLEALRPGTPFPVLELCGPQGSAKSSTQRRLRALIDPHTVPLRGRPRSTEDCFVAAGAGYIVSYENVSGLSPELQDALCVLATGGGFATRKLYTDAEENIIHAHCPVMLNGISANATRPDLIDRLLHIAMPEIECRRTEGELEAAFQRDAGAIFGGLLDLYANTLARLPDTDIDPQERPRMADFALLGEAMHQARGHAVGEFLELFKQHRAENMTRSLDGSPLAQAVMAFIRAGRQLHNVTAKEAFTVLLEYRPNHADAPFPQSPKGLMDQLRRYAPALRHVGIQVTEHGKTRDGYTVTISRASERQAPDSCSPSSQGSQLHQGGEHGERRELESDLRQEAIGMRAGLIPEARGTSGV